MRWPIAPIECRIRARQADHRTKHNNNHCQDHAVRLRLQAVRETGAGGMVMVEKSDTNRNKMKYRAEKAGT
jgi:hypothetical protein